MSVLTILGIPTKEKSADCIEDLSSEIYIAKHTRNLRFIKKFIDKSGDKIKRENNEYGYTTAKLAYSILYKHTLFPYKSSFSNKAYSSYMTYDINCMKKFLKKNLKKEYIYILRDIENKYVEGSFLYVAW